ncbi:MAG: sulfotransferase domain-containing protein [Alphaproteobacteria bacterium]|nr:sulfotransferase domain-containing protein [Alphaproteobacteria bacterium]
MMTPDADIRGGIMWLASYPKSGNTWMRVFLENLFRNEPEPISINDFRVARYGDVEVAMYEHVTGRPFSELTDDDIHSLRYDCQKLLAQRPESSFVKTHNCIGDYNDKPLIYLNLTVGAIYVVRNVFDVAVSAARHFDASIDDTVEGLCREGMNTPTTAMAAFQVLNSWSTHYRSWNEVPGFEPLLVRYEDLRAKPLKTFGKVTRYLGLNTAPERIKRAIRFSSISELQKQESRTGFKERVRENQKFFHSGDVGGWRKHLEARHVARLIEANGEVLTKLGYLKSGKPVF